MMEGRGKCNPKGVARGEAMVFSGPIVILGGIDPTSGMLMDRGTDHYGESVKDKILVFPQAHGSTVGSYVLYSLKVNGCSPSGIINRQSDAITVVGAVLAQIPVVDRISEFDPIEAIEDGDIVSIENEVVCVTSKRSIAPKLQKNIDIQND